MESNYYWAIVKDIFDDTMSQKTGKPIQAFDCLDSYTVYGSQEKAMAKCKEIFDHFYKSINSAKWIGKNNVAYEYHSSTIEGNEIHITVRITVLFTDI